MSKRKAKQYLFTLAGVDTDKVHKKYGIELLSNIAEDPGSDPPDNTTRLCELSVEKGTPELVSFLDEAKKMHSCTVSMIDMTTGTHTGMLRYYCFWDKHPFKSRGIGCPIRYVPSQITKKYHSEISNNTYTIKENITRGRRKTLKGKNTPVDLGEHYDTDGIFCSFDCCEAYIEDNKRKPLYRNSKRLLARMYNDLRGTTSVVIPKARHWRRLKVFGGDLDITQFREGFNKIESKEHGVYRNPKMVPVGILYEESIKF